MDDKLYMRLALCLAHRAYQMGEIPVGALVVRDDRIVGWAHNEKETRQDATAHAELLALQRAARLLGDWRLTGATLYSTLEPCPMCAGAMLNARIDRLVYAARDDKAGCAGSVIDMVRYPGLNHQLQVEYGILESDSRELLQRFFQERREVQNGQN